MKRHWRPGRILLALLLVSAVGFIFFKWPQQPLWRVPFDMSQDYLQILGIDEAKQILYARYEDFSEVKSPEKPVTAHPELRGYDLYSGKIKWRMPDSQLARNTDPQRMFKETPMEWEYCLSSNASQLACVERSGDKIELREFPTCSLKHRIKIPMKDEGYHLFATFSKDGSRLIVLTKAKVRLYDCETATLVLEIGIPKFTEPAQKKEQEQSDSDQVGQLLGNPQNLSTNAVAGWAMVNEPVQLTADYRFLAMIDEEVKTVLVYHLPSKKMIARIPVSGVPRFLNGGAELLVLPQNNFSTERKQNQPKWYLVEETGVQEIHKSMNRQAIIGETICCSDKSIVTIDLNRYTTEMLHLIQSSPPFWAKWDWLSDEFKMKIAGWLGYLSPTLHFGTHSVDLSQANRSFVIRLGSQISYVTYLHRNLLTSDDKVLAINEGTAISCWRTTPYRPFYWWTILLGVVLISIWFAWPHRMKTMTPAACPHDGK